MGIKGKNVFAVFVDSSLPGMPLRPGGHFLASPYHSLLHRPAKGLSLENTTRLLHPIDGRMSRCLILPARDHHTPVQVGWVGKGQDPAAPMAIGLGALVLRKGRQATRLCANRCDVSTTFFFQLSA